jgi:hypothetical protein
MDKEEMWALLKNCRSADWNNYRQRHPKWIPDLSGKDLTWVNLVPSYKPSFDLSGANLCGCKMPTGTYMRKSNSVPSFKNAIIDVKTQSDDVDLTELGAIFVSKSETMSSIRKPIVFISYAWANDDVVLAIDTWLRSKGLETKIDKRDFFAGSRIRDEITRVMTACDIILIFYSKQSESKAWPQFERELANDIEMSAKQKGTTPPRIIYVVIDEASLPNVSEVNRLAVMARGKRFELVCEEIYHAILQLPKAPDIVDLSKWSEYIF